MDHKLIIKTLEALLNELSLPFSDLRVADEGDYTRVEIDSPRASKIIGWHGEALNALQHLLKSMLRSKENLEKSPFILLDVDGYRKMQEEKVLSIARKKVDFVRQTGKSVALPPMSPYFRRVVHLFIANDKEYQDVSTESMGEGEYRQVVLKLKGDGEEQVPVPLEENEQDEWSNLDV